MTLVLPFRQTGLLDPVEEQVRLRAATGIARVRTALGADAWLVTRHADVTALFGDDRLGRSHPCPSTAARHGASPLFGGPVGSYATEHADRERFRRRLRPYFSRASCGAKAAMIDAHATRLVEQLLGQPPPVELAGALAEPLSIFVMCEVLGVPIAERDRFEAHVRASADTRDPARSARGLVDLFGYSRRLVRTRESRVGADDVVSQLLAAGATPNEVASAVMSLLFAGYATTVEAICMAVVLLLADLERWHAVVDRPSMIPSVVDELLRAPQNNQGGIPRYAREDIELSDHLVRAGELVLLDIGAANHDPTAFPVPEAVDLLRDARHHVAFGHGPRYCLGATLARLELMAALRALAIRCPGLRLATPVSTLRRREHTLARRMVELPVVW